ncbi:winged helix-turn-helix transcriptional regulator [Halorarius halobius]|uniref:winged helix-turn-helix transcriptional regulator n=1 Tax=Halorarius halobius TaxID=2962671 RepID=UPI0020CF3B27|nr:helix-turn-helix domain-containing protein [Halorarius halobius]
MDDHVWHGIHDLLGRKWTSHVLLALAEESRGFNAIEQAFPGLTPKVLSTRLDELRCRGFVEREVHATTPPETTYRLTAAGRAFADRLRALEGTVEPCNDDQRCVTVADCC